MGAIQPGAPSAGRAPIFERIYRDYLKHLSVIDLSGAARRLGLGSRSGLGTATPAAWLVLIPGTAFADLVWPALYLETRLFSWWAITVGLAIEYLFIRKLFSLEPWRALKVDLTANLVSALAGMFLIPLAGVAWELFPGSLYMWLMDWGTFNPLTWGASFLLACITNAVLEALVIRRGFGLPLKFRSKRFAWLVVANMASVGVACASIWMVPVRP